MGKTIYAICDFETTGLDVKEHYPIEVGIVFTDEEFNVLDTLDRAIEWKDLIADIKENDMEWPPKYREAYSVHQIPATDYVHEAASWAQGDVRTKCDRLKGKYGKVIMISDNAQFEWQFMQKFMNHEALASYAFPFHHSCWDASLILKAAGVQKSKKPHRAFKDACLLHGNLFTAHTLIKHWKEK